MARYAVFIGDEFICQVSHPTIVPQVLSIDETKAIENKARNSEGYKQASFIGVGYMTIKLNL